MKALIPIAHGSESLETITVANILRRGGVEVTLASIESALAVLGTRDITITADAAFSDAGRKDYDMIVLPGGEKGAEAFARHFALVEKLRAQRQQHRWTAAICASPALVLSEHGLLDGKQATCYPAFRDKLIHYVNQPVVVDGHCVTSQGPATAVAFGVKLVEVLCGEQTARKVSQDLLAS